MLYKLSPISSQEKIKELGWGLRTWDQWNFSECQSFDIATRDNRPEIQYHHRDSRDDNWPITGKADLIFFDPLYYIKKKGLSTSLP